MDIKTLDRNRKIYNNVLTSGIILSDYNQETKEGFYRFLTVSSYENIIFSFALLNGEVIRVAEGSNEIQPAYGED